MEGGGQGSKYWGGGARGDQFFAGCKLIGAPAPNQCQIMTFFTLKTNYIKQLRVELKSILLEIPSNKINGISLSLLPFLCFLPFLQCVCGGGGGGGAGERGRRGDKFCSFWTVGFSEAGTALRRNTFPFERSIFRGWGRAELLPLASW